MKKIFAVLLSATMLFQSIPMAVYGETTQTSLEELYNSAVKDAVTVEPEEILPLKTSVTKDNENIIWNETGDKVLMTTWNKYPESYIDGSQVDINWEVWTFSPKELENWYIENGYSIYDLDLRLKQLIGLPVTSEYTTMTSIWVAPEDLQRPAYVNDITKDTMSTTLYGNNSYRNWFNENIEASYDESAYPWTRLGYTYDWNDNGNEYGLTEFIIMPGAKVDVKESITTREYFNRINEKIGGNYTNEMKMERTYDYNDSGASAFEREIDIIGSKYFYTKDFYNSKSDENFTILPNFKTYQQTSWWSCGVASAMMVMNYYNKLGDWNEKSLADLRSDHSSTHIGTCTDQIIEMFEKSGNWNIESTYDYKDDLDAINLEFIENYLKDGVPIIVGWNDWGGHWAVIIGYDNMGTPEFVGDDVIVIADPFDTTDHNQDGYGVIGAERFIYNYSFYDFFGDNTHLRDKCFVAVSPK